MDRDDLADACLAYIGCLNGQDRNDLHNHVAGDVRYHGTDIGLDGRRDMPVADFRAIPDLRFDIALPVREPQTIASRLALDCPPTGEPFGLPVNGTRVRFEENVFYEVRTGRIRAVRSVIDKASVAAQI